MSLNIATRRCALRIYNPNNSFARSFSSPASASSSSSSLPSFNVPVALRLLSSCCVRPFHEGVELIINLNVDPRKPNQNVRGVSSLPHGTGSDVRVLVFAKGDKAREALASGADLVGDLDLVEKIQSGAINFDRCIAAPDCMASVGRVARILGPRGLMPNPKLGTVTNEIAAAVKKAKSGSVEFRSEKSGIVQAIVGKSNFDRQKLSENLDELVKSILQAKPSGARGQFIKSAFLHSTHGPSIPLDIKQQPFTQRNIYNEKEKQMQNKQ